MIYYRGSQAKLSDLDVLYEKVAKIALDVPNTESSMSVYKDVNYEMVAPAS